MKFLFSFAFAMLLNASLFAQHKPLSTQVDAVTVYHSGALVKRSSNTMLKSGVHELELRNVSSKIILNSFKTNNKELTLLNKTLVKKLNKEEMSVLMDKELVLEKQLQLIESKFNEVGFVDEVEELEKLTYFYSSKTLELKKNLRFIQEQITEAKMLDSIKLNNEQSAILRMTVSIGEDFKGPIQLEYVCGGVGWSPAYEVSIESASQKDIDIKYIAKAMNQSGEDWKNVTLEFSSSFPLDSPADLPTADAPWLLSNKSFAWNGSLNYSGEMTKTTSIAQLEGVLYKAIQVPSFIETLKLDGKYSLNSNGTVFTYPLKNLTLPASYHYFGYPELDAESYLVAEIQNWEGNGLIDGVANISFKGSHLGTSRLSFSEVSDQLLLPIGKDNGVFMTREDLNDENYFKLSRNSKRQKITVGYKYILKNNNNYTVEYELVDQVPISQTKSAEVEMEEQSGGELDSESGEITWIQTLEPGESKTIELIFTIEMDGNYAYSGGRQKAKFRTISCPSF
ncbi:MAG: DUF4139 domain-containing protein [Flavobacteriales bacterium]